MAWVFERDTKKCALKDDADVLLAASGIDSGIKYGKGVPTLAGNNVGAVVLAVDVPTPKNDAPTTGSTTISSSAAAVSTGGTSTAFVSASPSGVKSQTGVSGTGSASTSADTPQVSLKTALTNDGRSPPDYAVSLYKKSTYSGEVTLTTGKVVPLVYPENASDVTCFHCENFPCFYDSGKTYKGRSLTEANLDSSVFLEGGSIIADFFGTRDECCRSCRANSGCSSWWRVPKTARCVLNNNVPNSNADADNVAGVYI